MLSIAGNIVRQKGPFACLRTCQLNNTSSKRGFAHTLFDCMKILAHTALALPKKSGTETTNSLWKGGHSLNCSRVDRFICNRPTIDTLCSWFVAGSSSTQRQDRQRGAQADGTGIVYTQNHSCIR